MRPAFGTGNFFSVLGARAALGRTFLDAETWKTGHPIAVLSHHLWRDRFGSDRDIIGRTIQLDGAPVQVVGVMPASFDYPNEKVDLWQPWAWNPTNRQQVSFRRAHWLSVVARVKPGTSQEAANAQLQAVVKRLQRDYPATNRVMGAGITPLHEFLVGDTRLPLLVLLGAVALLLLIACANVGNLMLVKAADREREAALRLALGAGRRRLVRQALTESLVMSFVGGLAGIAIGMWGTRALQAMQPAGMLPRFAFRLRLGRVRLRARDHHGQRPPVRNRAGAVVEPPRTAGRAQGRWPRRKPEPAHASLGRATRHRRSGARAHAERRRRAPR